VIAGPAMIRRAMFMYGVLLPTGPLGHVDAGLGKTIPLGERGLIAPTRSITATGTIVEIDGVPIEFQLTPGTEAPAEMNFYFPTYRAVCLAENCTATLHNVYTPRGAEIRDALGWSKYIDDAIDLFLARSDVAFASHHWPRWGHDDILAFLGGQRDLYRYLHDETMRLANHGFTSAEIAEMITMPAGIADEWFNRDYYGTVNHNVKAVYQRYLGWFDANPAHLHELPPTDAAARIVEYMGGADAVLARARDDFARGEYRWVAQVVNYVVFAEPTNQAARQLQADTLEQLGYQAESGPWRSFYLTGAQELRNGTPALPGVRGAVSIDVMRAMTAEMVLDNCAVKLNGPRAAEHTIEFDIEFVDRGESYRVIVANGTLRHRRAGAPAATTATTVHTTIETFVDLTSELRTVADALSAGSLQIAGAAEPFTTFVSLLDQFDVFFAIIEP
jgi:alkyl sulfatase BDS1-like metallo-beta-lactamase superfamily hydrolase